MLTFSHLLITEIDPGTTVRLKLEGGLFIAVAKVSTTSELSGRVSVEFSLNTRSTSVSTLLILFRDDNL